MLPALKLGRDFQLEMFSSAEIGHIARMDRGEEEYGIKIGGETVAESAAESAVKCEELCQDNSACLAWSWNMESQCDQKGSIQRMRWGSKVAVSGFKGNTLIF